MDNISPQGFQQGNFRPSESLATAPPPPSEVKIRTMRTDLESMAKSGGGSPRFQNIEVGHASPQKAAAPASAPAGSQAQVQPQTQPQMATQSKTNVFGIVATIIVFAALIFGGWFAYEKFFNGAAAPAAPASTVPVAPTAPSSSAPAAVAPVPIATPSAPFAHVSLFKIPADQVLTTTFSAPGAAQSAADLQTYSQKMLALLATAKQSAVVLEIDAKDSAGNDASIGELLAAANASILDAQAVADFNPDATFFVYRDANGFWPGYILSLAAGASQSTAQADVQKLEATPSIANLFLENVGTASPAGFVSGTIASSTVRNLAFSGGTISGTFIYGWTPDGKNLILSTSQIGFREALAHLK